MILKSFDFQCDFDFQITTSKMIWILILNHLYLGNLILILKSSIYEDLSISAYYMYIIMYIAFIPILFAHIKYNTQPYYTL